MLLKASGLSMTDVTAILELSSVTTLSRWESGAKCPSIIRVLELLYNILVNDLIWSEFDRARQVGREAVSAREGHILAASVV